MEPVVYDFRINPHGTFAELDDRRRGDDAAAVLHAPGPPDDRRGDGARSSPLRKSDVDHFANHCRDTRELLRVFRTMINNLFPVTRAAADSAAAAWDEAAEAIRRENGFDPVQHEQLRDDLQRGRIGLARNRLPVDTDIRDVDDADLIHAARAASPRRPSQRGEAAIRRGEVAVVSLAAGVGSRWTTGAGVVKAVNPFVMLDGRHRSFLEIHLAKTRADPATRSASTIPHVVTTSYLTHAAIERHLRADAATTATTARSTSRAASRSASG